jgi:flagellar basal-body rod protein FlgB
MKSPPPLELLKFTTQEKFIGTVFAYKSARCKMFNIFEKNGTNQLAFGLKVLGEKNRQIARNIANADTPFYKAKKLEFYEAMEEYFAGSKRKLYATNEKHIQPFSTPPNPKDFVRHQNNPSTRTDGNDVNIEYEMAEQAGATIMHQMLADMVGGRFATLKEIIKTRIFTVKTA